MHRRIHRGCAAGCPICVASTANVARDLELLRRAVGDERLSYAGYSYGTVLGQTYSALYPDNVRAILLDGVADAQAWSGSAGDASVPFWVRAGAALGTAEALDEFFRIAPVRYGPRAAAPRTRGAVDNSRPQPRPIRVDENFPTGSLIGL